MTSGTHQIGSSMERRTNIAKVMIAQIAKKMRPLVIAFIKDSLRNEPNIVIGREVVFAHLIRRKRLSAQEGLVAFVAS